MLAAAVISMVDKAAKITGLFHEKDKESAAAIRTENPLIITFKGLDSFIIFKT